MQQANSSIVASPESSSPCVCSSDRSRLGNKRISRREAVVSVKPGGIIFKKGIPGRPGPGGKRGKIYSFSDAAQRRMTDRMMGIPWQELEEGQAFFVSLTWHDSYKEDASAGGNCAADGTCQGENEVCRRFTASTGGPNEYIHVDWQESDLPGWYVQLTAWVDRLQRRYGGRLQGLLWKKEFQARGAPHYHLAIFFKDGRAPKWSDFQGWCARNWNELVEPGDAAHLAHGVDVRPIVNTSGGDQRRLMRYLAKYMSKGFKGCMSVEGEVLPLGRIWGKLGEVADLVLGVVNLGVQGQVELCRRVRKWGKGSRYLESMSMWTREGDPLTGFRLQGDGTLIARLLEYLPECTMCTT